MASEGLVSSFLADKIQAQEEAERKAEESVEDLDDSGEESNIVTDNE